MVKILGRVSAVLALSSFVLPVLACSGPQNQPTEQLTVNFDRGSSTLRSDSIVRLANWSVDMKIKYPIRLWFSVVGMAGPDEKNANRLAAQRAENVKRMTDLFSMSATQLSEVRSYVNSRQETEMTGDNGAVVTIDLNPGCPNDCCDGINASIRPAGG
jgi:hypothetical protein